MDEYAIHPSWRGSLCPDCDQLFDFAVQRRKTNSNSLLLSDGRWWKSINALDCLNCSMCRIVDAAMGHELKPEERRDLEQWNARLTARVETRTVTRIGFWYPDKDPRPEPVEPPASAWRLTKITVQLVTGMFLTRETSICSLIKSRSRSLQRSSDMQYKYIIRRDLCPNSKMASNVQQT